MRLESREEAIDAFEETVVDDSLVFIRLDFILALISLLMNLVLLGSNEGPFVDIGMDLDIRVVAQLERVLVLSDSRFSLMFRM